MGLSLTSFQDEEREWFCNLPTVTQQHWHNELSGSKDSRLLEKRNYILSLHLDRNVLGILGRDVCLFDQVSALVVSVFEDGDSLSYETPLHREGAPGPKFSSSCAGDRHVERTHTWSDRKQTEPD